jgi:hypothetical protein
MAAAASACRVRAILAVTGLGVAILVGCGRSDRGIAVTAPKPVGAKAAACATLIARLPDDLAIDGHRKTTRPKSPYTAAFGAPPVIVRCGAAIPTYSPTADVLVVGGIEWLVLPDGTSTQRFVSFHHELTVDVTVTLPQLPANVLPPVTAILNVLVPPR